MSDEQAMAALAVANERRFARAAIRRELRGCRNKEAALALCAQHIDDPDPVLSTMLVFDLIRCGHRCGDSTALMVLNAAKVSANMRIGQPGVTGPGQLTDGQRERLVATLRDHEAIVTANRRERARATKLEKEHPVVVVTEPDAAAAPLRRPRPSLCRWCAVCAQDALPMNDGTCGFCGNFIDDEVAA